MRRLFLVGGALGAAVAGGIAAWRRNPRVGTRIVNTMVNPFLVRRGISGASRAEFGTVEHVGRRTGTRRLTPIHPVPTADGFRVMVPLGPKSEWARNVVAAGHCRMQFHDTVYELDEPVLLDAQQATDVAAPARWLSARLGFQYLVLRRFAEHPGTLDGDAAEPATVAGADAVPGAEQAAQVAIPAV